MKKIFFLSVVSLMLLSSARLNAQTLTYNGKEYFLNGANIPWNNYNNDFATGYDSTFFETAFTKFEAYGINCARFWLHTDGGRSPLFDTATGGVTGLPPGFFPAMDDLFARAERHNLMLIPSIWSFPMTNNDSAWGLFGGMHANLIEDSALTRTYINNALIPMVQRYANECSLLAWEVMNEPEWSMNVPFGGTQTQVVPAADMQRFTGMIAEAIHQNSHKMVTTGSAALRYNSTQNSISTYCAGNYWSDHSIQAAYNKPLAYLDFYEIHYYDWMTGILSYDPYQSGRQASYWNLDKPTIIGESQGNSTNHTPAAMLSSAYAGGYAGVLFWSYAASADSAGSFYQFDNALLATSTSMPGVVNFHSDSCSLYHGIKAVAENHIAIYPNPASDLISIKGIVNMTSIKMYDIQGRLVMDTEASESTTLNTSALPPGIYLLILRDSDNREMINKVVIDK